MGSLYSTLYAILAQSKNCPFGVNITIELKNIIVTTDNNDNMLGMF